MPNYDFTDVLSPIDFEALSKDLVEAELKISLEAFRNGADGGIDLRYAPAKGETTIIQCKRYKSFADLRRVLVKEEVPKIQKLNPDRYILVTSLDYSAQQADDLVAVLSPYIRSPGDIFGRKRLNSILGKNKEIEQSHFKLWIHSAGVLEALLNEETTTVSREEIETARAVARIYVQSESYREAVGILKKHGVCIIAGQPGIGKTTLARMLLLRFHIKKKFKVVKIQSDISEAKGGARPKTFYYYDDFLGQSSELDKLFNKNEEGKLLEFMARVKNARSSVFVLTTREYILNQAKLRFEKLARKNFDPQTCILDLSKYDRLMKARILYNHLYFSRLPKAHLKALLAERGYLKIVDHKNYSPRLIEALTEEERFSEVPAEGYLRNFLGHLDNPQSLWDHAYTRQIDLEARHVLLVLATLPAVVSVEDLKSAFEAFHKEQCLKFARARSPDDLLTALKVLEGTFVATRLFQGVPLISFKNPSVRDYMQNLLLNSESLGDVIDSAVFFDQAQWFYDLGHYNESRLPTARLKKHKKRIVHAMKRLLPVKTCHVYELGEGGDHWLWHLAINPVRRLAKVVEGLASLKEGDVDGVIKAELLRLAEKVASQAIGPWECISQIDPLLAFGLLDSVEGRKFFDVVKRRAMHAAFDLDDFRNLGEFADLVPDEFTADDRQQIRSSFGDFVTSYVSDVEDGSIELGKPDDIRDEAGVIRSVGELLQADTVVAAAVMERFADKKERMGDEEDDRVMDNSKEKEPAIKECTDSELEEMFSTLGH